MRLTRYEVEAGEMVTENEHSLRFNPVGWHARQDLIGKFGFAVPTGATIEGMRDWGPYIEVGSGTGYWAWEMRRAGIDVVATDLKPVEKSEYHWGATQRRWIPDIHVGPGPKLVRWFPDRTLLLVWPCYRQDWAYRTLRAYRGRTLVYVGEGAGGCTADDHFHDELAQWWKPVRELPMKRWFGMHDRAWVYQRRENVWWDRA